MMLAKKRDEPHVIGMSKSHPTSLLSFSDEHIIDNARALGVSLGNSFSESLASARSIKDFESQRTLTLLKKDEANGDNNTSTCLVVSRASNFCDDWDEDEDLEGVEPSNMPLDIKVKKIRKKKSYDKKKCAEKQPYPS
jgi:hypothetical protein